MANSSQDNNTIYNRPYSPKREQLHLSHLSDVVHTTYHKNLDEGIILSVAYFYVNKQEHKEKNQIVSRTFGKVAVIDNDWSKAMEAHVELPKDKEYWLVEILRDTKPGSNKGVFVLRPKFKIDSSKIHDLPPSMYGEEYRNGILYIKPKHNGPYWVLPNESKEKFQLKYPDRYATIVAL